jgi:hypothetical protein
MEFFSLPSHRVYPVKGSMPDRKLLFRRTGTLHVVSGIDEVTTGLLGSEFERCRLSCPPVRRPGTRNNDSDNKSNNNNDLFYDIVGTCNLCM